MESSTSGTLAMPGDFNVELYMVAGGEVTQLVKPVNFKATLLNQSSLPQADSKALAEYQAEVSELSRVMAGTRQMAREQQVKLNTIRKAIKQSPGTGSNMLIDVLELEDRLNNILYKLEGPSAKASWEELSPMENPLNRRLNVMVRTHWSSTSELTKTETDQLEILKEEFPPLLAELEKVVEEIRELDRQLENLKAPWTPGRVPSLG